jgi:hypothetical protein
MPGKAMMARARASVRALTSGEFNLKAFNMRVCLTGPMNSLASADALMQDRPMQGSRQIDNTQITNRIQ